MAHVVASLGMLVQPRRDAEAKASQAMKRRKGKEICNAHSDEARNIIRGTCLLRVSQSAADDGLFYGVRSP